MAPTTASPTSTTRGLCGGSGAPSAPLRRDESAAWSANLPPASEPRAILCHSPEPLPQTGTNASIATCLPRHALCAEFVVGGGGARCDLTTTGSHESVGGTCWRPHRRPADSRSATSQVSRAPRGTALTGRCSVGSSSWVRARTRSEEPDRTSPMVYAPQSPGVVPCRLLLRCCRSRAGGDRSAHRVLSDGNRTTAASSGENIDRGTYRPHRSGSL